MYNAAFDACNIDYRYFAFEPDDIGRAMEAIKALKFVGVSVAKPYKEEVMQYLDEIDPVAKEIGAVNVVHNIEGHLKGYNSDWIGAIAALKEKTALQGKSVAILGAGGAARAVAYGLKKEGVTPVIYNRSTDRGERLAKDMGLAYKGHIEQAIETYDIVINATSVWKYPGEDIDVPTGLLEAAEVLMDITPLATATPLMERAKSASTLVIGGARMLVLQGVFTFELFTGGVKAPVEVMQSAIENALAQ